MSKKRITILLLLLSVSAISLAQTIKIATLNAEWLSCTSNGPSDEDLQMSNIATVIKATNADIVALQEVGTSNSYATIDILVGLLGSEWAGNLVPWSKSNCSQNQGIVYKKARVTLLNSSLIKNGGTSYAWSSGRFPALYNVSIKTDSGNIPVSIINIHAKATSSSSTNPTDDYNRRKDASTGLKTLLDGNTYLGSNIVLIGDYNDYLNGTQCQTCTDGSPSPYKNFMDDNANYRALTGNLSGIDHIIISNELFAYSSGNGVKETSATYSVSSYRYTTSDHTPVSATFSFTGYTSAPKSTYSAQLRLYPNPTRHTLNVESMAGSIAGVRVCSMSGTVIFEQKNINEPLYTISTSAWATGPYIVTVYSTTGEAGSKLVISDE